ncbi:MAG TPA: UDP-N-acetylmuramoyl-L-alanine--D-glutamate ligase [Candidatus Omnitrophota bacterium]|nr:UDP-N-acetylmuramoyl-L-alanine--D-glutamate ligase [Candidatus Omnitrophota bacterium]HRZ15250.1 UDP-N-acetylmuramoyl-L-alanine--D-glutamate ligase [Candidatus Omnitrophota bacterium]
MRNADYFKDKRITVVGCARSGGACANLLQRLGARVSVTDNATDPVVQRQARSVLSSGIAVEFGVHTPGFVSGADMVVISPGVPDTAAPIRWARERSIPIVSEIEVAWMLCPAPVIAVTGSNGKTTTTTLIGRVLAAAGKKTFVCGNIGTPFTGEVGSIQPQDWVVLEISSFQLEHIRTFKPKIALILNINPNHLDRYPGMREYAAAKERIALNQDATDFLVLNAGDSALKEIASRARAPKAVYFTGSPRRNQNQAAVEAVASILGIAPAVCAQVFDDFKGIEHRMEMVRQINRISFINDSKATTVESAVWALQNLACPVVLIAGGRDKGLDYRPILELARQKVKRVILIGEARAKIRAALSDALSVQEAGSLEEAVAQAYRAAAPGDCVLLSPMCASYDMFKDYEERGRKFKQAVLALNGE